VLPSRTEATGNGIALPYNSAMGIINAVIATAADTNTSVPTFLCAALYITKAAVTVASPFKPFDEESS
jgi:hypothetical protein